jgi:type II secretion system protein I
VTTLRSDRQCGFTLLEVMVALIIAALALAATMASISQMVDAGTTLRERTYASWIAENRIAEMRLQNVLPEVDDSSGEVEFADLDVFFAGSDDRIWRGTGFIGEPIIPGESNRAWSTVGQPVGEQQ